MVSTCNQRSFAPGFVLLIFVCLTGCGESNINNPANKTPSKHGTDKLTLKSNSANYLLGPDDYKYFTPGRSLAEVLNDVQWRGNFECATEYKGRHVTAITYGVLGGYLSDHGTAIFAIFVDEKFKKFVRWPIGQEKIRIGDFGMLIRLLESDPASVVDIDKEQRESKTPHSSDPGLGVVFQLLEPVRATRLAPILRRNAELRDQFNAARLRLGMRASDVQAIFKAVPIESGVVGTNLYQIYGSIESFDITADLHYSNVLVVLRDGKVTGIYSGTWVPGGDGGLREMRHWFVDLPVK